MTEETNENNGAPTSAPKPITDNNIAITNPFAEPKGRNNVNESANQPNKSSEPQVTFNDIVNQKNFGSLSKELFDKVNEGDVDSFNSGIQSMMKQVYKTAIEDSNKLMTSRLASFEQDLMSKLNNSKEADSLVSELKAVIPYAKDADVEPVARQVLSGFLRQGMTKTEAIAATNSYFDKLAERVGQKNKPAPRDGIKTGSDSWDTLFN